MGSIVEDKKKRALSLLFILALLAATCYFLLRDQELTEIWGLIQNAKPGYLLLGVAAMAAFFGMEALSLKTLMRPFGYPASFRRCYGYSLVDFYFSSITPGCCGGQPSQIYYMKRDGIPISVSSLILLLFNLAYHVAMLLLVAMTLAIGGRDLIVQLGPIKYFFFYGAAAQLFLIVVFIAAVFSKRLAPALVHCVTGVLNKLHLVKRPEALLAKVQEQINEYQLGAAYIKKNPVILGKVLVFATCHLALLYSIPFWVYKAFGLSGYSLLMLVAVQASLTLSFESLPIPGGVGVAESSFVLLYSNIFGPSLVLPAMLLSRGLNYYGCLAIGGIVSALLQSRRRVLQPLKNSVLRRPAST